MLSSPRGVAPISCTIDCPALGNARSLALTQGGHRTRHKAKQWTTYILLENISAYRFRYFALGIAEGIKSEPFALHRRKRRGYNFLPIQKLSCHSMRSRARMIRQLSVNNLLKISVIAFLQQAVIAQKDIAPKYANEFLSIGVGAGALAQSGAVVAGVDDVTAGYWNPAGLTQVADFLQVGAMHAEYFAGIAKYDYIGLAKPIDPLHTVGFTMIRFAVDDIPNTTQLIDASGNIDYDRITTFTAGDYGFLFSYARKMPVKGLSVGGNFKVIYRHIGEFARSWGFGLDAGVHYTLGDRWRLGAAFRDVTSTFNAWSFNLDEPMRKTFELTGNEIPENGMELTLPRTIVGVQFRTTLYKKWHMRSEIDVSINTDGRRNVLIRTAPISLDPQLGIAIGYGKWVTLRGGCGNFQWIKNTASSESLTFQPNMGIGVGLKRVQLDYALTDIGDASIALYSHVFSLRLRLSEPKKTTSSTK